MSQKCCSKVDFVTVFQNHRTFRIFKKKIGKLLVAKLTKQEFKHAESTTRSRSCRKLVRFTILNRKFYNFLNKDFISSNISWMFMPFQLFKVVGWNSITW